MKRYLHLKTLRATHVQVSFGSSYPKILEVIAVTIDDWIEFDVNEHVTHFVARTFNRVIVGAPTCRRVLSTARDTDNTFVS